MAFGKGTPIDRQIFSQSFTPSATADELTWFNDFQRQTVSSDNAAAFLDLFGNILRSNEPAMDVVIEQIVNFLS